MVALKYRKFCAKFVSSMLAHEEKHKSKEIVTDWLNGREADFFDEVIVKLVQRLGKRQNYNHKETQVFFS
jgi:hypothetical protein